jgi:hypothetical protein
VNVRCRDKGMRSAYRCTTSTRPQFACVTWVSRRAARPAPSKGRAIALDLASRTTGPLTHVEDDARFVGHLCVEFLGEVLLEHLQPPDSFDNFTTCF